MYVCKKNAWTIENSKFYVNIPLYFYFLLKYI